MEENLTLHEASLVSRIDGDETPVHPDSIIPSPNHLLSQFLEDGLCEYAFYYDSNKDICYVNSNLMSALGIAKPYIEKPATGIYEFIHPDDVRIFDQAFAWVKNKDRESLRRDFRLLTEKGKVLWVQFGGISEIHIEGSGGNLVGHLIDITHRVRWEIQHKNIIDGSSAIVFFADLKTHETRYSENLRQLLPDAKLEFEGDLLASIFPFVVFEDRQRLRDSVEQMIEGKTGKYSTEFRLQRPDGSRVWISCRCKSFFDASRQAKMIAGNLFNLSEMNQIRENVDKSCILHEITELPGRGRLLLDIEKMIHNRYVMSAAIVLLDIKGFHTYNDRFGRKTGDELLKGLSQMLSDRLPAEGILFHIHIDSFCILWPHASRLQVQSFMEYLQQETANPVMIGQDAIYTSFSMSAALFPSCGSSADELLANAEITLHKIKKEKWTKHAIYVPSDKRELKEKLDFEFQLTKALRNKREGFQMYYQPLVDAASGSLIGAEALLRWLSHENEIIKPEKIIAGLEATGYMDDMSEWVLEQGIRQCSEWLDAGVDPQFLIHINITAEDLMRPTYSESVFRMLKKYSMSPDNLILEITETSLMRNISICRQNLIRLRNGGVKIALDDFGTGYSSLNYLRELPVNVIKIDRAFIEDIQRDRFNHSFISAIILLAHSISRSVCIEGIEEIGQADFIRDLKADSFQGFYFGRPVSTSVFESKYFKNGYKQGRPSI